MGPTLVAMATKFGLGAEIQSPTGLYYKILFVGKPYFYDLPEQRFVEGVMVN